MTEDHFLAALVDFPVEECHKESGDEGLPLACRHNDHLFPTPMLPEIVNKQADSLLLVVWPSVFSEAVANKGLNPVGIVMIDKLVNLLMRKVLSQIHIVLVVFSHKHEPRFHRLRVVTCKGIHLYALDLSFWLQ